MYIALLSYENLLVLKYFALFTSTPMTTF